MKEDETMKATRELANSRMNASGKIVKAGEDYEKNKILNKIVPQPYRKAHEQRLYHMHDLEFYEKSYNCIGINVSDLLGHKFYTYRGAVRKLNREIISLTNMQAGGIGFLNFDADISVYVKDETIEELAEELRELFLDLNTYSRKGCEKAYVTFNFGITTTQAARKVSLALLKAYDMGDENGNPFVFPNLVFKLQKELNINKISPNHDIYLEALKTTSKRMVPTYFCCDSTSNRNADPAKIGIMGCRTRVIDNLFGEKSGLKRGNVACVTLNLVQMAYDSINDTEHFISLIKNTMNSAKESLLFRYNVLIHNADFSEVYKRRIYKDSEYQDAGLAFRNGTLSIGFIGLWDALSVIHKKKWHYVSEMEDYLDEAFHIVHVMREMTDSFTKETGMNFSLLASAAEGVSGSFATYDAAHAGKEMTVSKKGYYSNSFHIPVDVETDFIEKIKFEGMFHHLCNGGSITYVELEEMPENNIEAVQEIITYAYENDCNYIGINFPMDNCNQCSYIGRITNDCPRCGSSDIRRLRRVSGYLAEVDRFVKGKKFELLDRVNHDQ